MTPPPPENPLQASWVVSRALTVLDLKPGRCWVPLSKLPLAGVLSFAAGPHASGNSSDPVVAILDAVARDLRLLRPAMRSARGARGYQRRATIRAAIMSAALRVEAAAELHRRTLIALDNWTQRREAYVLRKEAEKEAAAAAERTAVADDAPPTTPRGGLANDHEPQK